MEIRNRTVAVFMTVLILGIILCGSILFNILYNEEVATTISPKNSSSTIESTVKSTIGNNFLPWYKPQLMQVAIRGGLGDSYGQIQKVYGKPSLIDTAMINGIGIYFFNNDNCLVMFQDSRVWYISLNHLSSSESMTIQSAEVLAKQFFPSDITYIRQHDMGNSYQVYEFKSKTLSVLFSKDMFHTGDDTIEPGICSMVFKHSGDHVESLTCCVGSENFNATRKNQGGQ